MGRSDVFGCSVIMVLSGCVGVTEPQGASDQELIGSPQGPTLAATVSLYFLSAAGALQSSCTGTALTDHFILTAGHCVEGWPADARINVRAADGSGAATITLYSDTFETFRHPGWGGGSSIEHDIALIYLRGSGIAGFQPRGNLFADAAHPWYGDYTLNGWVEGFGLGSAPGSGDCAGLVGTLRRNQQFPDGSGATLAIAGEDLHCPGDSGGPWMFNLLDTQWRRVQYAVHHGYAWGGLVGGGLLSSYDVAAALPEALPWIEATLRARLAPATSLVVTEAIASGYRYHAYREQPLALLRLSLAGSGRVTGAPSGWCSSTTSATCAFGFVPGTTVQLTASPAAGSHLSGWASCPAPSGNVCTVTLSADLSLSASFVADRSCPADSSCMSDCLDGCDLRPSTCVSACKRACAGC